MKSHVKSCLGALKFAENFPGVCEPENKNKRTKMNLKRLWGFVGLTAQPQVQMRSQVPSAGPGVDGGGSGSLSHTGPLSSFLDRREAL